MKISLATVTALVAASAPTAMAADWKCNGSWNDGGLKRLSFKFQGYCEDRSVFPVCHPWQRPYGSQLAGMEDR
jgi:hypothetical protein